MRPLVFVWHVRQGVRWMSLQVEIRLNSGVKGCDLPNKWQIRSVWGHKGAQIVVDRRRREQRGIIITVYCSGGKNGWTCFCSSTSVFLVGWNEAKLLWAARHTQLEANYSSPALMSAASIGSHTEKVITRWGPITLDVHMVFPDQSLTLSIEISPMSYHSPGCLCKLLTQLDVYPGFLCGLLFIIYSGPVFYNKDLVKLRHHSCQTTSHTWWQCLCVIVDGVHNVSDRVIHAFFRDLPRGLSVDPWEP